MEPEAATSPGQAYLEAHIFLLVRQNIQQPVDVQANDRNLIILKLPKMVSF